MTYFFVCFNGLKMRLLVLSIGSLDTLFKWIISWKLKKAFLSSLLRTTLTKFIIILIVISAINFISDTSFSSLKVWSSSQLNNILNMFFNIMFVSLDHTSSTFELPYFVFYPKVFDEFEEQIIISFTIILALFKPLKSKLV